MKYPEIVFTSSEGLLGSSGITSENWETKARENGIWSTNTGNNLLATFNLEVISQEVNNYLEKHPVYLTGKGEATEGWVSFNLRARSIHLRVVEHAQLYIEFVVDGEINVAGKTISSLSSKIASQVSPEILTITDKKEGEQVTFNVALDTSKVDWVGFKIDHLPDLLWAFTKILSMFKSACPIINIYSFPVTTKYKDFAIPVPTAKQMKVLCSEVNENCLLIGITNDWASLYRIDTDYEDSPLVHGKGALAAVKISSGYLYRVTQQFLTDIFAKFAADHKAPEVRLTAMDSIQGQYLEHLNQYKITLAPKTEKKIVFETDEKVIYDPSITEFSLYYGLNSKNELTLSIKVKANMLYKPITVYVDAGLTSTISVEHTAGKESKINVATTVDYINVDLPLWFQALMWLIINPILNTIFFIILDPIANNKTQKFLDEKCTLSITAGLSDYGYIEGLSIFPPGERSFRKNAWVGSYFMPERK